MGALGLTSLVGLGALDVARKNTFFILSKKMTTAETPTKPSTVWTMVVFLAGGGTENKDMSGLLFSLQ